MTYPVPGAVLTEREHTVPLPHGGSDKRTLTVFTREACPPEREPRPAGRRGGEHVIIAS